MDAENRIAIVTGASSGIGEAFARHLVNFCNDTETIKKLLSFSEIWLIARRKSKLELLKNNLQQICPKLKIKIFDLDFSKSESIKTVYEQALSLNKKISILINNAGYGTYGDFDNAALDTELGQIDINCRTVTESCGRFLPLLEKNSIVINTSSLAAFAPLGGFAVYAASKAFSLYLSIGLASEWQNKGIKVCALCPGPVDSEFSLVASAGARKKVKHGYSAQKTTIACLRDAANGKYISMPRLLWRFRRLAAWLFGPILSAKFAHKFLQRPRAKEF